MNELLHNKIYNTHLKNKEGEFSFHAFHDFNIQCQLWALKQNHKRREPLAKGKEQPTYTNTHTVHTNNNTKHTTALY